MAQASTALVSLVFNTGVSAEELSLASGIDLEKILTPTLVPYAEGIRLWTAAAQLTGDPATGLHAGARFDIAQLPVLGSAFAHAPTVRDALTLLTRLLPLVIRDAPIAFVSERHRGGLTYRSPGVEQHGAAAMMAAICKAARDCSARPIPAALVDLQAPRPADPEPYRRYFQVMPRWGQAQCRLLFANGDLDARLRGADSDTSRLLLDRAQQLFGLEQRSLERAVEDALRGRLADRDASLEATAGALGTTARSLQRQLREAGTSFSTIRERVLLEAAREMLGDEGRRLEDIAASLGFANRPAFTRAFRRWTGQSPRSRTPRP